MDIQKLILKSLATKEEYVRKVIPHLKRDYFISQPEKVVYDIISNYIEKYDAIPPSKAVAIELQNKQDLDEKAFSAVAEYLSDMYNSDDGEEVDIKWLIDQTETFCKDRAIEIAFQKGLEILDNTKNGKGLSKGALPKLFQDALMVSFDTKIGHDYIDDAEKRWEYLHEDIKRIPIHIEKLMEVTQGGWVPKTLNVFMAESGVGKSLIMCDLAANNLMDGYNVLYITLELSEEWISERIDANLLDVDMATLRHLPKDDFMRRMNRLKSKVKGKLKVVEYAPRTVGAAQFRHLLRELKTKTGFVPDIIYVDYINLCVSSTTKDSNSYEKIKAVAEELRGLGIEENVPVISATQTNRGGYGSNDPGMENVSDSIGLPMTADFYCAIVFIENISQYKFIQNKSRYNDISKCKVFFVNVEKMKMRMNNIEVPSQDDLNQFAPKKKVLQ